MTTEQTSEERVNAENEALRELALRAEAAMTRFENTDNGKNTDDGESVDWRREAIRLRSMEALRMHHGNPEFCLHHVTAHMDAREENGEIVYTMIDDDFEPTAMTPEDFVAAMKVTDRWAPAFPRPASEM